MLSSDQNVETIGKLFVELKKYVELRGKCLQIDFVSKLSKLLTAMIVVAALFLLGAIALVFVSMMVASALAPHVGGTAYSYAIIVAAYVLIALVLYSKRTTWIQAPITNFLGHLFLDDLHSQNEAENNQTPNENKHP